MATTQEMNIPVRVVGTRRARTTKRPVVAASPAVKKSRSLKPSTPHPIERLPDEQKRRWMWGIVAAGMFVAVVLWAMSLGAELQQVGSRSNIFTEISGLLRTFRVDSGGTPKQQEIRQLEKDVFPQFE